MKYLIDTSVWSLALRRKADRDSSILLLLSDIIRQKKAVICGAVRQELLSGIRSHEQFIELRNHMRAFEDTTVETSDYELAAEYYNLCRAKGVQGSNTDFLLCALSANKKLIILTTDKDFELYYKIINFNLELINLYN